MGKRQNGSWRLRKIGFLNWYLFGAREIEMGDLTAIIGHNGSGKSSILDAMQTILTGNHASLNQLNALVQGTRSSKEGRRTVKDYCLGVVSDSDDESDQRTECWTHIFMCFERNDTGQQATIGLSMTAHVEAEREDVKARWIVEGEMLSPEDFIARTMVVGEYTVLDWRTVLSRLHERNLSVTLSTGAELFVKEVCSRIGPKNAKVDPSKFIKNIRNVMLLREIRSPTEFIRNYVLDAKPLELEGLRKSISRYDSIQKTIDDLLVRISEVVRMAEIVRRIEGRIRTHIRNQFTLQQGLLHYHGGLACAASQKISELTSKIADLDTRIPQLRTDYDDSERRFEDLIRQKNESDANRAIGSLAERVTLLDRSLAEMRRNGEQASAVVRSVKALKDTVAPYNKGLAERLAAVATPLTSDDGIIILLALMKGSFVRDLEMVASVIERTLDDEKGDLRRTDDEIAALRENIARVRRGERVISPGTQNLVKALKSAGIKAVPLCDLVETVDADWHKTLEAFLGVARESLIVPPEQYTAALRVFRQGGDKFHRAALVNTTKTNETAAALPGSLATVATVYDPHARAFLDYRTGRVMLVETEEDLKREDNAVTRDLMVAGGRTVRRMDNPKTLMMGVIHTEQILQRLEIELSVLESGRNVRDQRIMGLSQESKAISTVASIIKNVDPADLAGTSDRIRRSIDERQQYLDDIQRYESETIREFDEQIAAVRSQKEAALRAYNDANADRRVFEGDLEKAVIEKKENSEKVDTERQIAMQLFATRGSMLPEREMDEIRWWLGEDIPEAPSFPSAKDDPFVGEVNYVDDPQKDLYHRLINLKEVFLKNTLNRAQYDAAELMSDIAVYGQKYNLPKPEFMSIQAREFLDNFPAARAWILEQKDALEKNDLIKHQDNAAQIHQEAISHFRGDFIGKLSSAIHEMDVRMSELNRHLKDRAFHGLVLQFAKTSSRKFNDMLELLKAARDPSFEFNLFTTAATSSDPVSKAMRFLENLARTPEYDLSELQDPRNYFEFDIVMTKDGQRRSSMTQRNATGSGGEAQLPVYVSLASALAATAYPVGPQDGGIPLAVFDEAFNRMDVASVAEYLSFLSDIGLQAVIAAPDTARGTFIQTVDTIVTISRVGRFVSVDVQHIKPYTHDQFRRENPALRGFDRFKEEQSRMIVAAE